LAVESFRQRFCRRRIVVTEGSNSNSLVKFPGMSLAELEEFADDNTILIQRTVRSGQTIVYNGNIVVLGDVNPGAEVIAAGNVIVMGVLRGVVHAGASGDLECVVVAFRLRPTQLRIANHITRAPDGEEDLSHWPEVARIKDGVVTIELFQTGINRQNKLT